MLLCSYQVIARYLRLLDNRYHGNLCCFDFLFVKKLFEDGRYDYERVQTWAKRCDMLEAEKLVFPINVNDNHWVMVVIYVKKKEMHFLDSLLDSSTPADGLL